jgi:hypothetical protein
MIIRLSKKLSGKIKEPNLSVSQPHSNPYLDWHAHVFSTGRGQYIVMTNSKSLFSVFIRGAGITNGNRLTAQFRENLQTVLVELRADIRIYNEIILGLAQVHFAKAQDKRVISSINDNIELARIVIEEELADPNYASARVNQNIHTMTGYARTTELFLGMKAEQDSPD